MYNGRFSGRKRRLLRRRQLAVIVSMALLLVGLVGGSLAYLLMSTEDVENTFTPASVPPVIDEDFDKEVKSNVAVTNNGDVKAYIRAAVVINWLDSEKNIVANPEGHTYEIVFATGTGWIEGADGYYYYTQPVASKGTTGTLITSANPTEGSEYTLQIDIAAQTIQADGVNSDNVAPVILEWGAEKGGSVESVNADGTLNITVPTVGE